jgi:plasmid stability protein
MKTTMDLPDELVKELKLRAVHEGKKLKDAVADILRKGLAAEPAGSAIVVKANKAMMKRRKALTKKFISGEWGVELAGYEAAEEADRRAAAKLANALRK